MIVFLTNLTVSNKQFYSGKSFVGLRGQLFNSQTMYKLKIKLLYIEDKPFCTETELLNFNNAPPLVKLDIAGSRPVPKRLIFSGDIPVVIHLINFLFFI